jgi:hypothetical protein
MSEN